MKPTAHRIVALSLLAVTASAGVASAYPGEKFIKARVQAYREGRSKALQVKQETMLIKKHPLLSKVYAVKRAEFKANTSLFPAGLMGFVSGAGVSALGHSDAKAAIIGTAAVTAEILTLGAISRNGAANEAAHEATMQYAADHNIKLVPAGLKLGVIDKLQK